MIYVTALVLKTVLDLNCIYDLTMVPIDALSRNSSGGNECNSNKYPIHRS